MNEYLSPEQQRQKVEHEEALLNELDKLSRQCWELRVITQFGRDKSEPEPRWFIQRNGRTEYFSLENAKSKLQEIINESTNK